MPASELNEAKKRAEIEKLTEEARAKRLKNDQLEGQFWYRDVAEQSWNIGMNRIRDRLEAFPDECEMLFPAEVRAKVKESLAEKVFLLLKEMSEWEPISDA